MNLAGLHMTYLPETLLLLIIGCFRPLVRRAGPHVNLWFVGWSLLLLHFVALMLLPVAGLVYPFLLLGSHWTLDLCAFCFVLVAERNTAERLKWPMALVLAISVLLSAALSTFPVHPIALDRFAVLLFLAPSLFLLSSPSPRSRQSEAFGFTYFLLAALTFAFLPIRSTLAADATRCALFLMAAWVFQQSSERATRGVFSGTVGLAAWGFTFPIVDLCHRYAPAFQLPRAALEWPIYLMAGGVLLTLLEEHVLKTEKLATHDPLTELPNRRMFEDRLLAALEEARKNRTTIACLVIDVDNFKTINDTLGHAAGDQLLRALAARLSWHLTPRDLLARTGGDEFTALLAGVHDEHHHHFVASAMMSATSFPIAVDGKSVKVRISIGIALSPDHADDTEGLRRAADLAMYSAKKRGGSLLAFAGEE